MPYLLCLLAEAELAAGRFAEARSALAQAAQLVAGNGNALHAAEGLRLEGELALAESADAAGRQAAPSRASSPHWRWRERRAPARSSSAPRPGWRNSGPTAARRGAPLDLLMPIYAAVDDGLQILPAPPAVTAAELNSDSARPPAPAPA